MHSELDRNLVEPIEYESIPIRAYERSSDCTLTDLIADRGAQVVDKEGFEVILAFPCREVDQKWYSSLSIFALIQVLDQGIGGDGLARTGLTDDEQASLRGLEGGDDVVRVLLGDGLR